MPFSRTPVILVASFVLCGGVFVSCSGTDRPIEVAAAPAESLVAPQGPQDAQVPSEPSEAEISKISAIPPSEPFKPSPEFAPAEAAGAVRGVPDPSNTASIVAIANYFADLPGIEMSMLTPGQREKFLHRANSELCTCGCKDDTLAKCYMNDSTCPVVKGMLLTVRDEIRTDQ